MKICLSYTNILSEVSLCSLLFKKHCLKNSICLQHPSAPDGVFPDSTTWESSAVTPSLRQRSVGALRPEGGGDGSRWDPYIKMGKGGGGSGSVARSTPNLTELEGLGVGVGLGGAGMGYTCLGTSSSQGYISMPSSQEMESRGGGYCRVGTDGKPADSQSPQQQQQQTLQPHKGYVSLASMSDTSPSTLTTNSSAHSSPRQPPQQPPGLHIQGYVNHQPLWPASKDTASGKGCVMASEIPNKVPATSLSLLTSEVEEVNQGIVGAALTIEEEESHEGEELHSPESYCRFGLRPGMIPVPVQIPLSSNAGMIEEILEPERERTSKQGSGYVTLSDEPRLQNAKSLGMISGCHKDQRVCVSGHSGDATSGYVPHRQFEKRDALALSQTAYQDYNEVFPTNIDDTSHITSV